MLWVLCLAEGYAHCSKPSGVQINLKETWRSQPQEQPGTLVSLCSAGEHSSGSHWTEKEWRLLRSRGGWEEVGGWRGRAIRLPGDELCYVGRRFGTKCAGCAQGISPSDLVRKARSKVFHLNCFTCMVCNKQLSTGEELYVIDENKFVCKDDYLSSSSLKEGSLNSGRGLAPPPARPALSALLPGAARPARSSRLPVTQRAALGRGGRGGLGARKGIAWDPG